MAKKKITIEWSKGANLHFNELLEYLFTESEKAAEIVGNEILNEIENLNTHPFFTFHQTVSKKQMMEITGLSLFIVIELVIMWTMLQFIF